MAGSLYAVSYRITSESNAVKLFRAAFVRLQQRQPGKAINQTYQSGQRAEG
jgi:hypothetical protein